MAQRLKWTEAARDDLNSAATYIAGGSAESAASFVRRVLQKAETLTTFPESAPMVPEFDNPRIREVFIKRYRLIYKTDGEIVEIAALVHSARDLNRFLDDENRILT